MAARKEIERPDVFTKDQVLSSKRYENIRDAVSVVLENGKSYSLAEVDELIEKFMKGKVK
nr:hypothetical protein [uncultured Anaerocolumna sp.]